MRAVLVFLLFSLIPVYGEFTILRLTPSGKEVKNLRQINITFSKNMISLGDMNGKAENLPIKIEPDIDCTWRWVDTRNLACQFNGSTKIISANQYKITIKKDFKSEDNEILGNDISYDFSTEKPKLLDAGLMDLSAWDSPARPKISLYFNLEVSREQVKKFLDITHQEKKLNYSFFNYSNSTNEREYARYWYVELNEDLARDSFLDINLRAGIKAKEGDLVGVETKSKRLETLAVFRLENLECFYTNNGDVNKSFFSASEFEEIDAHTGQKKCEVNLRKEIQLTNPVIPKDSYQLIKITPDPTNGKTEVNPFQGEYWYNSNYREKRLHLPTVLKSKVAYTFDFSEVQNIFGEKLTGPNKLKITFDKRSPKVASIYNNSVVEHQIKNDVPVSITNMKNFNVNYASWTSTGSLNNQKLLRDNPDPEDVTYYAPIGINTMLKDQSGIVVYNIEEEDARRNSSKYWQSIISTPYQVHAKMGHYNSLIWVLDMSTGEAVHNADVRISDWGGEKEISGSVLTNEKGIAILPGLTDLFPNLNIHNDYSDLSLGKFISVKKDNNLTVLPISYLYSTGDYYEDVPTYNKVKNGHLVSWGTTPQGVYKAGSNIDYKIYVRMEELKRLALPPTLSYTLLVIDPVGSTIYRRENIELNEFGSFQGMFNVPKSAPVGIYEFQLVTKTTNQTLNLAPMKVLVTDFTPSEFKVSQDFNSSILKQGDVLKITANAKMHSGGAFTGTEARITVQLKPLVYSPENEKYKKFNFYGNRYTEESKAIHQSSKILDEKGEYSVSFRINDRSSYGKLYIESAVKDDRGKFISTMGYAEYFGKDQYLGTKLDKWMYKVGEASKLSFVVLDEKSLIKKNLNVTSSLKYLDVKTVKVKGSGNAYVTRNESEWTDISTCKTTTTDQENECQFKIVKAGYYKVITKIDESYESSESTFFASGGNDAWWGDTGTDDLSLEFSSKELTVDQEVEILIKNPLGKSKALITIERYGILDQWVEDLDSSAQVFKFKVKPDYIPGFYMSVELFSPRVKEKSGFGKLDLGKPTNRSIYKRFLVKDDYKRIDVVTTSNKEIYLPSEEVNLKFKAVARNEKLGDVEVAVAVLDEAVFDLIKEGENYFDAYKGFSNLGPLDVRNYSLVKLLIGRQKFEKKGANQGGGGSEVRSNFDYLAYWNPSIILKDGQGEVNFKLPDNLTGWKVLVMSADKKDRLGLSTSKFVTKIATEIRSALPNTLVENDKFKARFTIYNRDPKARNIDVTIASAGLVSNVKESKQTYKMEPNEKKYAEISLDVGKINEKRGEDNNYISFIVKAGDKQHTDTFIKQIPVIKQRPGYSAAQYEVLDTEKSKEINIEFPDDIYPDVGGLEFTGSTTRLGLLEDGFSYLKKYPYSCWEQKLTKLVGAAQFLKLEKYIGKGFSWIQASALIKKTIEEMPNYQTSDGGMSYYGKYSSEYLSAYTLLAIGWIEKYGYSVDPSLKQKLIAYSMRLLRNDMFDKDYNSSLKNSIRAIFLAGLSQFNSVDKTEIDRFAEKIHELSTFSKFHYYIATINTNNENSNKAILAALSNLVVDAASVRFNEVPESSWYRIHYSPKRTQCSALMALTLAYNKNNNLKLISDLPAKLAMTIAKDMQTKSSFWESTQSTIYCMNALIDYSETFEKEKPDLKLLIKIADKIIGTDEFKDYSLSGKKIKYELTAKDVGKKKKVTLVKEGTGTAYVKTLMSFSFKESDREFNNGISVKKIVSVKRDSKWIEVKAGDKLKRGDLLNVDILLNLPTLRHFVVIDDPIAGGMEPLNAQLATTSIVDDNKDERLGTYENNYWKGNEWLYYGENRYTFYHKELRHDRALFYSEYLMPGNYHVSYRMQAIATGEFSSMPTIAKEMYNPEVFGSITEMRFNVEEK